LTDILSCAPAQVNASNRRGFARPADSFGILPQRVAGNHGKDA
jgi:hypothetical protein